MIAVIHVGFTGTRRGMTPEQADTVTNLLRLIDPDGGTFHHGDCVGADEQAAEIARTLCWHIVAHPPVARRYRANFPSDESRPAAPYLERNRAIVAAAHLLIATPRFGSEAVRSGTWATIRYAVKAGKPTRVVLPDGGLQGQVELKGTIHE